MKSTVSKNSKLKNKLIFSVIACVLTAAIATGSVYAWFTMNADLKPGEITTQVTSGSDATMEIYVDDNPANVVRFKDAAPGKIYNIVFKVYNATDNVLIVNIDLKGMRGGIYFYRDGVKTLDTAKNLFNVFAFKKSGETRYKSIAELLGTRQTDMEAASDLRLIENLSVPTVADKNAPALTFSLQLMFLESIVDFQGNLIEADINDYQGQTLFIDQIVISNAIA